VARRQQRFAQARAWEKSALAITEHLALGSFGRADRLQALARIELEGGRDFAAAEAFLRQAQAAVLEAAPESLELVSIRRDLGRLLAQKGRLAEAETLYRQELSDLERRGLTGTRDEAEIRNLLGHAQRQRGDLASAADSFCRATGILDLRRSRLGGSLESRSWFESETHSFAFARLSQPGPEDAGEIAAVRARLEEIKAAREALIARLRRQSPRLGALQAPAPLDLGEVRRALDSGTVLLAYAVGPERSYLFVVMPDEEGGRGLVVHRLPVGKPALEKEIDAYRRLLTDPQSEHAKLDARAARLYDLLLEPAEKRLARARRILISADGPLHLLPWAALRRHGQYLAEWRPVHLTASTTVYRETLRGRRPAGDPGTWKLVAFGDPRYPAIPDAKGETIADSEVRSVLRRGLRLEPLPATREEIREIAALFPGAEVYLGEAATEERTKQASPHADLLHFAGHGLIDERFPLDSALALTIPMQLQEGHDNGLLQAWEIFEDLRLDASLVTLSACDTTLGREMGGKGSWGSPAPSSSPVRARSSPRCGASPMSQQRC
jgi:CHAT domain-containing protein